MNTMTKRLFVATLLIALVVPSGASAASFEVSGWIPYWAPSAGPRDAREHLEVLTAVMPFAYSVKSDGTLTDLAKMNKSAWRRLRADADEEGVRVTPTVMWSDTNAIHAILSDPKKRKAHIKEIVEMVEDGDYDGVDIDYEGKKAATRPYFSAFLEELDDELDGAFLSCTIEARTPPDSLYRTVPATIDYANDLKEIGKYCDRVNLMTYDQQRADLKLNDAAKGAPYYPVADPAWVKKVVNLMDNDIPKDKIVLGVASYGREVGLTVSPNWFQGYSSIRAVNPEAAEKTAKKYKVKPSENKAGEQSVTYLPKGTLKVSDFPKAPSGTSSGDEVAQRALAYANKTGKTVVVNLVWWSDAKAVEDKVELARELGLRGVALFKIDGEEDEDIWELF
jgi:spore germination protein YaaH